MAERNNQDRANDALGAIVIHNEAVNGPSSTLDLEEGMTDLLSDIRHAADLLDIDWVQMVRRIENHFVAEVEVDDAV